jgi:hypothetical protein
MMGARTMPDVRLIDADAILDFINSLNFDDYNLYSEIFDCIDNAPTIDAQPVKRAKWVKYPSIYRCSNCGNPKGMPKPYCELCGARMSDHFANAGKMVEER